MRQWVTSMGFILLLVGKTTKFIHDHGVRHVPLRRKVLKFTRILALPINNVACLIVSNIDRPSKLRRKILANLSAWCLFIFSLPLGYNLWAIVVRIEVKPIEIRYISHIVYKELNSGHKGLLWLQYLYEGTLEKCDEVWELVGEGI